MCSFCREYPHSSNRSSYSCQYDIIPSSAFNYIKLQSIKSKVYCPPKSYHLPPKLIKIEGICNSAAPFLPPPPSPTSSTPGNRLLSASSPRSPRLGSTWLKRMASISVGRSGLGQSREEEKRGEGPGMHSYSLALGMSSAVEYSSSKI